MKKKKILLTLLSLISLSSCGATTDYNTFFTNNYLETINLFNMPEIKVDNTRLYDKNEFYYTTSKEEFSSYSNELFNYLLKRESMTYILYKGEARSDLLDKTYNRYNMYTSNNIEDYKTDNGYTFYFSYYELNEDTSLRMLWEIDLDYYNESLTNEKIGTDFTYNACMKIKGVDNPHYLFYTIKE